MDILPSEEMLWMDWAFLIPAEEPRKSEESSTWMCFFSGFKCRTVGLSRLWSSCRLICFLSSIRGCTSETGRCINSLATLLSVVLLEGQTNACLLRNDTIKKHTHTHTLGLSHYFMLLSQVCLCMNVLPASGTSEKL